MHDALALNIWPSADDVSDCQSDPRKQSKTLDFDTPNRSNADHALESHKANNNQARGSIHTSLAKRPILDESGHRTEEVLTALDEVDDTGRMPDFYIPCVSDYLQSNSTDCSKILTSITLNALDVTIKQVSRYSILSRKDCETMRDMN